MTDYSTVNSEQLRTKIRETYRDGPGYSGIAVMGLKRDQMIRILEGKEDFPYTDKPNPVPSPTTDSLINIDALLRVLEDRVTAKVDMAPVYSFLEKIVSRIDAMEKSKPKIVSHYIKVNELPPISLKTKPHRVFEDVLRMASARMNVFLYGPAGTGKTTIAKQIAETLSLPCYCQSVCAQSGIVMLSGYQDAHGNYVSSAFRKAYESGGVYCLDEIDAGNANVLSWLNSAIDNGSCTFPDQIIKRHKDFICIATGNTVGTGATREYVGRNALDASTLSRFCRVYVGIDSDVEKAMANGCDDWYEYVVAFRAKLDNLQIRHIVTSRAIREGAALLSAGCSLTTIREATLYAGLSSSDRERLGCGPMPV